MVRLLEVGALPVRATACERVEHGSEFRRTHRRARLQIQDSRKTAHASADPPRLQCILPVASRIGRIREPQIPICKVEQ